MRHVNLVGAAGNGQGRPHRDRGDSAAAGGIPHSRHAVQARCRTLARRRAADKASISVRRVGIQGWAGQVGLHNLIRRGDRRGREDIDVGDARLVVGVLRFDTVIVSRVGGQAGQVDGVDVGGRAVRDTGAVTCVQTVLDHAVRALVGRPSNGGGSGIDIDGGDIRGYRRVGPEGDLVGGDAGPDSRRMQLAHPVIHPFEASRGGRVGDVLHCGDELRDERRGDGSFPVPALAERHDGFDGVSPLPGEAPLPVGEIGVHLVDALRWRDANLDKIDLRHDGVAVIAEFLVGEGAVHADVGEGRVRQKLVGPVRPHHRAELDRLGGVVGQVVGLPLDLRVEDKTIRALVKHPIGERALAGDIQPVRTRVSEDLQPGVVGGVHQAGGELGAEARRREQGGAGAGFDDDVLHALVLQVSHQAGHVGHRRHVAVALGHRMMQLVNPVSLPQVGGVNPPIPDYTVGEISQLAG